MKYLLLSLIVLAGIVSCQKEITDQVPFDINIDSLLPGKLEADIDSVQWTANGSVTAKFVPADTSGVPALITISALSTDGRELNIGLIDSGVHVYSIYSIDTTFVSGVEYSDSTSIAKGSFYSNDTLPSGASNTGIKVGTVSITSIDTANKRINGTFEFTVYRHGDTTQRKFTGGSFTNVPYTSSVTPGSATTDTFHVKINDTLFNAFNIGSVAGSGAAAVGGSDSMATKSVTVYFPDTVLVGNYNFDSVIRRAQFIVNTDTFNAIKNAGTLDILEHNTTSRRVRGNFAFVGLKSTNPADSAKLTEGYFSVELP